MAAWLDANSIKTVVLNKANGLGVWLNGRRQFFGYGAPHGSVDYMVCR
jgi:hypothetical protein